MSDETNSVIEEMKTVVQDVVHASKSMADEVKDKLESVADSIRINVVAKLVNDQIEKRVATVLKALEKVTELKNNVAKIKPDSQLFGSDGKIVQEAFSKAKLEELNKAKQDLQKHEEALSSAINENKFDKLNNLIK